MPDKVSLWNEKGGGLYGSERGIDAKSAAHQDVIVTVLSESEVTANSKKSDGKSKGSGVVASATKNNTKDVEPGDLKMSGALIPSENGSGSGGDLGSKLSRKRSASTPNIVLVEPSTPAREYAPLTPPATAPARPPMMTRRKYKPPPPVVPQNKLDAEIKKASAPPRRVISDGKWVRHRRKEPEPESEPEPPPPEKKKPPKPKPPPELKLGWIRPPLIPRKDANELQPTQRLEVTMPQLPPIRTLTGKLKKPIFHQFVPGANSGKLNSGVIPGKAARLAALEKSLEASDFESDISDETESAIDPPPKRKKSKSRKPVEPESTIVTDTTSSDSSSDSDETELAREVPERVKGRKSATRSSDRSSRKSVKLQSRSEERLAASALSEETRPSSEPRSKHVVSETKKPTVRRASKSQEFTQTGRKASYNAGDRIPVFEDAPAILPTPAVTPSKVSSWLTATLDPFLDIMKGSSSSKEPTKTESVETPGRPLKFATKGSDLTKSTKDREPSDLRPRERGQRHTLMPKDRARHDEVVVEYESTVSTSTVPSSVTETDLTYSELSEISSGASTPTLKRSGARRGAASPTKHRRAPSTLADTESTITETTDASTITESDVTETSRGANSDFEDPSRRDHTAITLKSKAFPSTGRRLSTIASVETLSTHVKRHPSTKTYNQDLQRSAVLEEKSMVLPALAGAAAVAAITTSVARRDSRKSSTSNNRLKKSNTKVSNRSTRSRRSKIQMSIPDIMDEVATEEDFYMPELRTLVGGVIKVLFKAVLSKSDAAVAAGLFSKFAAEGAEKDATRSIHEMGVALERLKSYHNRIPKKEAQPFLIWASGALKIYTEYVRTWRLGFQDVVVNLVPADEHSVVSGRDLDGSSLDGALPRNDEGYVVNAEGQLVDVAFLLKRPLIRLKGLTKTIKAINSTKPTAQSEDLLKKYEALMEVARAKVNGEKARMEDQKASQIDTSRARDPTSLGALRGVKIDPDRCVRARDVFDMHLIHSTGQEVISKIELFIRDNAPGRAVDGDILLCQSDGHKKWLFLPPILLNHVSARQGRTSVDMVVMLQGVHSRGQPWEEVLQLTSNEPENIEEWLSMLATHPVPPKFSRATLVQEKPAPRPASSHGSSITSASYFTESTSSDFIGSPVPSGVDVPLGEKNGPEARTWNSSAPGRRHQRSFTISPTSQNTDTSKEQMRDGEKDGNESSKRYDDQIMPKRKPVRSSASYAASPVSRDLNQAMNFAGQPLSSAASKAQDRGPISIASPPLVAEKNMDRGVFVQATTTADTTRSSRYSQPQSAPRSTGGSSGFSVWMPGDKPLIGDDSETDDDTPLHFPKPSRQANGRDRATSMPMRSDSPYQKHYNQQGQHTSGTAPQVTSSTVPRANVNKSSSQGQTQHHTRNRTWQPQISPHQSDAPPPPPPHQVPMVKSPAKLGVVPSLTPDSKPKRRSSSPLKHQWHPDSGSEGLSDDYTSGSDSDSYNDIATSESEGEDDIMSRLEDYHVARSALAGAPSDMTDDITPSQSASQAGVRDVPVPEEIYLTILATVSTWNSSEYQPIHDGECLVEISPGKISAYETVADLTAPIGYQTRKKPYSKPVVALTLTPHVVLQVLNANDILISSIPTWDSRFQPQRGQKLAKVRFHTRYATHRQHMIKPLQIAMHNNPIYQRLERDRPRETAAELFDKQNPGDAARYEKGRSWFGGSRKSGSFRKSNTGAGSTVGNTEYSHRTTSSLRNGLQALLQRTSNFNIDKSTIFRRSGDGQTSGRDREETGSTAPRDVFARTRPEEMNQVVRSIHCSVIRYDRIPGGSRQPRRLGKVTLHLLHAARGPQGAVNGHLGPEGIHSGEGHRLVVANENSIILDRVLPPSCFVMDSRGIMVHVFDEKDGGKVTATGGVGTLVQDLYCLTSVSFLNRCLCWKKMRLVC